MSKPLINQNLIYPVSQAREIFGALIDQVKKDKTILVTKQGRVKAAIIDFDYLLKMKKDLDSFYQKTYIDRKLLPFTRVFSDREIQEWLTEDSL